MRRIPGGTSNGQNPCNRSSLGLEARRCPGLEGRREIKKPFVITQRGRATAVLMSLDAYQRSEAERDLLLLLARGEKEIAAEVGHSLGAVLAEADALLAEDLT
jgi:PHD/YefM family antitoxin component YafN of YafNO toxin-antitoxin module